MTFALISIAVIPFGPEINVFGVKTYMQLADLNIGVLFILALSRHGRVWSRAGRLGVE